MGGRSSTFAARGNGSRSLPTALAKGRRDGKDVIMKSNKTGYYVGVTYRERSRMTSSQWEYVGSVSALSEKAFGKR